MKVFIRSSEQAEATPDVLASYPDDSNVEDNAHGSGMVAFTVPQQFIKTRQHGSMSVPTLAEGWKEASSKPVSPSDRTAALHELIGYVLKHGTDTTKWPAEARSRHATIEKMFAKP